MIYLFYFFLFFFGSAVGSFLNAVIYRLETNEGIVKKRSHCPKCVRTLAWYDLIPIVSFIILRGQCRYCGKKISWQYPTVETATGLLFIGVYQFISLSVYQFGDFGFGILNLFRISDLGFRIFFLVFWFFIVSCLIVIFVYDLRHYIIPDKIIIAGVAGIAVYHFLEIINFNIGNLLEIENWDLKIFWPYFLSALAAAAFFLFLVLVTRGRGMGLGDVKLVFLMGLLLGWPSILIALFLAFLTGATVGAGLVLFGRKKFESQVPFGPFLVGGTLMALFWGQIFLDWQAVIYF